MKIFNYNRLNGKKMLVICPSRERPGLAYKMAQSFKQYTSDQSALMFCLDNNDPTLNQYKEWIGEFCYSLHEPSTLVNIINRAFYTSEHFDYYSVTNDDFEYQTPGWDQRLMKLAYGGISYGNDMMNARNLCTSFVVDGDICRELGWLELPSLHCLCADCVWHHIGEQLNILRYDPQVIIEHHHFLAKKSEKDHSYDRTNSKEMINRDRNTFRDWRSDCKEHLTLIKELLEEREDKI